MNKMFDLTGKKALVVGGAGDLGYSMLEALLEAGASAVIVDVNHSVNEKVSDFLNRGFNVYGIVCDISDRKQVRESYEKTMNFFDGNLDILVNAAGIQRRYPSEVFPEEDWDLVLEINLTAPFLYCQLAGRTMIEKGYGKIISIASVMSYCGGLTIPAYAASKGGISQMTKTLANDWADKGIYVNAIAPGYMKTKLNTELMADAKRTSDIFARIPQKRWGTGDDMKGITIFLASSASDYINGTVIPVDGGYLGR